MAHAHDHNYEERPQGVGLHSAIEGEDEKHEKKSVLKKVKDKAKKIKDTLTKHDHGHEHDHDRDDHGYNQDWEEDEEEEEIEQDPEVHGAPMYESTAIRSVNLPGQKEISGQTRPSLGDSATLEEDPHAPKSRTEAVSPGNYQTKTTDPTQAGGEEAGVDPILRSFGKMNVFDESQQQQRPPSTGSHDQFSPKSEKPQESNQVKDPAHESTTNSEKISSATSVIADKAISAKNVVASKMTETLAPVYEKVTKAGTAVASKVQGTGTTTSASVTGAGEGGVSKIPDKGVSVKEYFSEKLRPGDEDRALSEVLSEALHNLRVDEQKQQQGMESPRSKPVGNVTESPELASRLGPGCESSGEGLAGKGMVKKLRGAVHGWFGKGGETHETESQSHVAEEHGSAEEVDRSEERRLQESTN